MKEFVNKIIENIRKNKDNIVWHALCGNSSDIAMNMIKENFDNIDDFKWTYLSGNPNSTAMNILKNNQKNIHWNMFSKNPSIFELDYDFFHQRMNLIRDELMQKTWHPDRFMNWCMPFDEKIE